MIFECQTFSYFIVFSWCLKSASRTRRTRVMVPDDRGIIGRGNVPLSDITNGWFPVALSCDCSRILMQCNWTIIPLTLSKTKLDNVETWLSPISSRQRRINILTDRNNQSGCRKNASVCQKHLMVLTSVHANATNLLQIRPLDVQLNSVVFHSAAQPPNVLRSNCSKVIFFFVPDGIQFHLSVRSFIKDVFQQCCASPGCRWTI